MTRRFAALLVAAVLLSMASSPVFAEDDGLRERVAAAVRDRDLARAIRVLETVAEDPARRAVADYTDGVVAALDLLPPEVGNDLAARLAVRALTVGGVQDKRVWAAAMRVRRRILDDADVEVGQSFLNHLIGLYSTPPAEFQNDLAELLLSAGRQIEALDAFQAILAARPEDHNASLRVAEIHENLGDVDAAIAAHREFLGAVADDPTTRGALRVRVTMIRVLLSTQRDFDGAERELDVADGLIRGLAPGPLRDEFEAAFAAVRGQLVSDRLHAERIDDVLEHIDHVLIAAFGGWVLLLGGGLSLLRARRLV